MLYQKLSIYQYRFSNSKAMLQHRRCRVPLIAVLSARSFSAAPPSSRLFVGGLSYDTNETVLKDAFGEYGEILEVKVICNRWTGKSKGFAFIKFASEAQATRAVQQMNGQFLEGRNIRVHYFANKKQDAPESLCSYLDNHRTFSEDGK